jgi:hypothetical protein
MPRFRRGGVFVPDLEKNNCIINALFAPLAISSNETKAAIEYDRATFSAMETSVIESEAPRGLLKSRN